MAKPGLDIIRALRAVAQKLESSTQYQWGHMGSCNCGFLAQEITKLAPAEIHRRAMLGRGDWTEQLNDYCAVSGLPFDGVISELLNAGFDADDLMHLERLSDPFVLSSFPLVGRNLKHNIKADTIKYLRRWADLLEDSLVDGISLPRNEEIHTTHSYKLKH